MACPRLVRRIRNTQNVGDSLLVINNNFYTLDTLLCDLKTRVQNLVEVRTFFYYGPSPGGDPAATGMRDGQTNKPSNSTIENFVNSVNELNLANVSKRFDRVNVIYQKTGFKINQTSQTVSLTSNASFPGLGFSDEVPVTTDKPDRFDNYAPVFILWQLTHDGERYIINGGYPKYVQDYQQIID